MDEFIEFFMDPLRLTLIVAGVVVLFAIVIFSRKSSKRNEFAYSTPSSKEFSFGSQGGNVSESMAKDMLVDEEVIVLPRKQKESEMVDQEDIVDPSLEDRSHSNAYNVRVEPSKPAVSEFRAFQNTEADDRSGSDIFDDDIIATPKPFEAQQTSIVEAKEEAEATPQFQRVAKPVEAEKPEIEQAQSTPAKELFVVLHVIAVNGEPFNGLDILDATKTLGLAFGKHSIFHYPMSAAPAGDSKFCLVNMSATGNFESSKISLLETNGVSLIMRLPIRGASAQIVFSNMVGVAQALARKLGGEILDQTRVPLTTEIVDELKADIAHFESSMKHATSKESIPEV